MANREIKTSDGKILEIENECLIWKSEAIRRIYEKSLTIDNPDTKNGLCGAVAILYEMDWWGNDKHIKEIDK